MKITTRSVTETEELAARLAPQLKQGAVLAFFGGMGMGKTAFVRGLAKGLHIDADVCSPTFAIVNDYGALVHFDMYRINSWDDLYSTGFFDYADAGAVLAVEWSENIENALPKDSIRITISQGEGENDRIIEIIGENINEDFIH